MGQILIEQALRGHTVIARTYFMRQMLKEQAQFGQMLYGQVMVDRCWWDRY